MRSKLAVAATLLLGSTLLVACSESEAAFREAYRTRSVESCAAGARSAATGQAAGFDFQRMCECAVDRYMEATSIEDLRAQEKQTDAPPAAQRALQQCLAEQMGAQAKT